MLCVAEGGGDPPPHPWTSFGNLAVPSAAARWSRRAPCLLVFPGQCVCQVGLFLCLCKWPQVCCRTSTETVRTLRDGEPRTATSTFTQLLSSTDVQVQCCFTSTETKRTIRDGSPGTAISIFTRLPSVYLCSTAATRVGLLTAQLTLNAGPRTHSFAP